MAVLGARTKKKPWINKIKIKAEESSLLNIYKASSISDALTAAWHQPPLSRPVVSLDSVGDWLQDVFAGWALPQGDNSVLLQIAVEGKTASAPRPRSNVSGLTAGRRHRRGSRWPPRTDLGTGKIWEDFYVSFFFFFNFLSSNNN